MAFQNAPEADRINVEELFDAVQIERAFESMARLFAACYNSMISAGIPDHQATLLLRDFAKHMYETFLKMPNA
jgi:hypothetical protein